MNWGYVAAAVALGCLAAVWLRRRSYRLSDDELHHNLNPWWVPVIAGLGATLAGPFYAGLPFLVVATYVVALVWAVVLAFIDFEVRRLPDMLVLPAYPVTAVALTACSAVTDDWAALLRAVTCAGAAVLLFLIPWFIFAKSGGLGLGDVKLIGVLMALLGWLGWYVAAFGLITGAIFGGVAAAVLLTSKRADRHDHLCYGPSLILGAYVCAVLGVSV